MDFSPAMNSTMARPRFCQTPMAASANSAVSGFCNQSAVGRPTTRNTWFTKPTVGWNMNSQTSAIASNVLATGRKYAAR